MKIILRDKIEGLGEAGETKNVKNGYGRNYLIPQGLAYPATKSYLKVYEEEKQIEKNAKVVSLLKHNNLRINFLIFPSRQLFKWVKMTKSLVLLRLQILQNY